MTTDTGLLCPKCRGHMRNYDRSGILVEQCEDCRGIFLDRGELERLIEAEGGGWSGHVAPPATLPAYPGVARAADRRRVGQAARGYEPGQDSGTDERDRRDSRLGNLLDLFGGD